MSQEHTCGCTNPIGGDTAEPVKRLTYQVSEAAATLGISERHVRTLVDRGEISAIRLGRRILIPVESLRRRVEDV